MKPESDYLTPLCILLKTIHNNRGDKMKRNNIELMQQFAIIYSSVSVSDVI